MKKIISFKTTLFVLAAIIIVSGWLHRQSFNSYFFQDDWFSFRISEAKNLPGVFSFFIPRQDVIYFRPLGMQIPFLILGKIFGINQIPFRVLTYITHGINIVCVFILSRQLTKNKNIAYLVAFLYGTSAIHFLPFYWSAIYAFEAGPTFFFLSFIFYLLLIINKKTSSYILSFSFFVAGLLTNEMVAVLPVILFIYSVLIQKKSVIKNLLPFLIFAVFLFLLRFSLFIPPTTGVYQFGLGRHIVSNLKTYLLWSFNWSEILTEQMASLFVFNSNITNQYSNYANLSLITILICGILFYLLPILVVFQKIKRQLPYIFFYVFWFITGLTTVLLFPHHKFAYYLPISLVGLLIISASFFYYLVKFIYSKNRWLGYVLTVMLITNWLVISSATLAFNAKLHWAPRRANIALKLINAAKDQIPPYIIPYSSENKLALNDQDAMRAVFGKNTVTVYLDYPSL